ncbi:MAG: hypothetical protein H0X37_02530 [Herpetosiphonaceae bacterium]|nr:hypothetical protein [Herpetosiphonaceae bacterium]
MRVVILLVGIVIGCLLGAVLGLLIGLGALSVPGVGPVIAAGSLASVIGTASIGALAGAVLGVMSMLVAIYGMRRRSQARP